MISLSSANSHQDYQHAGRLIDMMAVWDAEQSRKLGIATTELLEVHYGYTENHLASKFAKPGCGLILAYWNEEPAGCIAYAPFDQSVAEIHKFFVNPQFRSHGIGKALLNEALDRIEKKDFLRVVLQTAIFMKQAIALYTASGFRICPAFRDIPASFADMEVFMERQVA